MSSPHATPPCALATSCSAFYTNRILCYCSLLLVKFVRTNAGPSLNVLIKTMTMMALMLAPAYKSFGEFSGFGECHAITMVVGDDSTGSGGFCVRAARNSLETRMGSCRNCRHPLVIQTPV